jgi:hypothetical protein
MSLVISKVFTYDTDAGNYIQAVEAADGQALEAATRQAINNFVVGCKQDGIWNAIKASCILAGARTLAGALVPLVGTAPTNVNFVTGDYNRKTGLVGNGSSKYLGTNRTDNADPRNNFHMSTYVTTAGSKTVGEAYIGVSDNSTSFSVIYRYPPSYSATLAFSRSTNALNGGLLNGVGLLGTSRQISSSFFFRRDSTTVTTTDPSALPTSNNIAVFAENTSSIVNYSNARLAFYSIGESLDLALLDTRVTALIAAFAAGIP